MKNFALFYLILPFITFAQVAESNGWPVQTVTPTGIVNGFVFGTPSECRPQYPASTNIFGFTPNGSFSRFHMGVDLGSNQSSKVYAFNSGFQYITQGNNLSYQLGSIVSNNRFDVNGMIYFHCSPIPALQPGDYISQHAYFANYYFQGADHIHIQPKYQNIVNNSNIKNYLYSGILPNYSDNCIPKIVDSKFFLNGRTNDIQSTEYTNKVIVLTETYSVLFGKVDIEVSTDDEQTSATGGCHTDPLLPASSAGNIGLGRIGYRIRKMRYNSIILNYEASNVLTNNLHGANSQGWIADWDFSFYPPFERSRTALGYQVESNPHRSIITSAISAPNGVYDRFWNTRLKNDQLENYAVGISRNNNLDARVNAEAKFQDGLVSLDIIGQDFDNRGRYNGNFNNKSFRVLIDNFRPYIKSLMVSDITSFGLPAYQGGWTWNATSGQLVFNTPASFRQKIDDDFKVVVTTSEPMKELFISDIIPAYQISTGNIPNYDLYSPPAGSSGLSPIAVSDDRMTFTFQVPVTSSGSGFATAYHMLALTGKDLAENNLLGFKRVNTYPNNPYISPVSISATNLPYKDDAGNWQNNSIFYNQTTDAVHGFVFGNYCSNKNSTATCLPLSPNITALSLPINIPVSYEVCDPVGSGANCNSLALIRATLTNGATHPITTVWDFGDGSTATSGSGTHTFSAVGTYHIVVTVTAADYELNSAEFIVTVYDPNQPAEAVIGGPDDVQANQNVTLTNETKNINPTHDYLFSWDLGPNAVPRLSFERNPPVFHYEADPNGILYNIQKVKLCVFDINTQTYSNAEKDITIVNEQPVIPGPTNVRLVVSPNNTVSYTNPNISFEIKDLPNPADYTVDWNFGDGNIQLNGSTSSFNVYLNPSQPQYIVTAVVREIGNTSTAFTLTTTIYAVPVIVPDFNETIVLAEHSNSVIINTSNTVTTLPPLDPLAGAYKYKWIAQKVGGGKKIIRDYSTAPDWDVTFDEDGIYEVKLCVWRNMTTISGNASQTGANVNATIDLVPPIPLDGNDCPVPDRFCTITKTISVLPCGSQYLVPFDDINLVTGSNNHLPDFNSGYPKNRNVEYHTNVCTNSRIHIPVGLDWSPADRSMYSYTLKVYHVSLDGTKKTFDIGDASTHSEWHDYPFTAMIKVPDNAFGDAAPSDKIVVAELTVTSTECAGEIKRKFYQTLCLNATEANWGWPCIFDNSPDIIASNTQLNDRTFATAADKAVINQHTSYQDGGRVHLIMGHSISCSIDILDQETVYFEAVNQPGNPGFIHLTNGCVIKGDGGDEGFVARITPDFCNHAFYDKTSDLDSAAATLPTDLFELYPNPATGGNTLHVRYTACPEIAPGDPLLIRFVDMRGGVACEIQTLPQVNDGMVEETIPLPALPAGLYLVQYHCGPDLKTAKLLVE